MKKNRQSLLLFISIMIGIWDFIPSQANARGVVFHVGNGGDVLYCRAMPQFELPEGTYSLDFIVALNTGSVDPIINSGFDWEFYSTFTLDRLYNIAPHFYHELQKFKNHLFNEDSRRSSVWMPAELGLVDIQDESLFTLLPPQCLNADGRNNIYQAVIRRERPGKVIYSYDPRIFSEDHNLVKPSFTFLAIHEWLWSYASDAYINRLLGQVVLDIRSTLWDTYYFQLSLDQMGGDLNGKANTSARSMRFYKKDGEYRTAGFSPFFVHEGTEYKELKLYNSTENYLKVTAGGKTYPIIPPHESGRWMRLPLEVNDDKIDIEILTSSGRRISLFVQMHATIYQD